MKKWLNWQAPLWRLDNPKVKFFDMPVNTVVDLLDDLPDRSRVLYVDNAGRRWEGLAENRYLEPYIERLPAECVDMQGLETPDPRDAAQYAMYNRARQTNLCGELCVCYLLGIGLRDMLTHWEQRNAPFWRRIFGGGNGRGTGNAELLEMARLYDRGGVLIGERRWTPATLERLMGGGWVICSVYIDRLTGRLRGSGVLHWVVPVEVVHERQGYGTVVLYNPFPNRLEVYSWGEFAAAARSPYGAVVYR